MQLAGQDELMEVLSSRILLRPSDLARSHRFYRRTTGLRREEVAVLCHMSADYYSRLEQGRGPQPSEQMVASIAQGLHLSLDERDHLFRLAGHRPPERGAGSDHVSPGVLRIFDRLAETPAEIVTELVSPSSVTRPASPVLRGASATGGSLSPRPETSIRQRTTTNCRGCTSRGFAA